MLVKEILVLATLFIKHMHVKASETAIAYKQEATDSCPQEVPTQQRKIHSELICCLVCKSLGNCKGICYNSLTKMCRFYSLELSAVTQVTNVGFIMYFRNNLQPVDNFEPVDNLQQVDNLEPVDNLQQVDNLQSVAEPEVFYIYGFPSMTYETAKFDCESSGYNLSSPRNLIENFNLTEYAKFHQSSQYVWISFHDAHQEDTFVNPYTGTAISYENWEDNQPGGGTGQNCVALNTIGGQWHDKSCDDKYNFICEGYN